MKEKSPKTTSKNSQKRFKFDFFFFVILLLIGFALFSFGKSGSFAFPVIMVALGFGVYRYFQNGLGNAYRIPRHKIIRIEISDNQARIVFRNEDKQ